MKVQIHNLDQDTIKAMATEKISAWIGKSIATSHKYPNRSVVKCDVNSFINNAIILASMTNGSVTLRRTNAPIWRRWLIYATVEGVCYKFTVSRNGVVIYKINPEVTAAA